MCVHYQLSASRYDVRRLVEQMGLQFAFRGAAPALIPADVKLDYDGYVLRNAGEAVELLQLRWGFPHPGFSGKYIESIHDLENSWWHGRNAPFVVERQYRCLVPFTRFAKWDEEKQEPIWFGLKDQKIGFFPGIWRPWFGHRRRVIGTDVHRSLLLWLLQKLFFRRHQKALDGTQKRRRVLGDIELFTFLATEPNALLAQFYQDSMPVIITHPEQVTEWLGGGDRSLAMKKPYPADLMQRIPDIQPPFRSLI